MTDLATPATLHGGRVLAAVADMGVEVAVSWPPAQRGVESAFAHHRVFQLDHVDLRIEVVSNRDYRRRFPAPPAGASFETLYGRFLLARWSFDEVATVVLAPNRSPLRAIRPLVDAEGHAIHVDAGRMLIERVLSTYVQLCRTGELSYVHGAAMADRDGRGLLISGVGGVGKTSLALELGLHRGWSFVSDDMVPLTTAGVMHLNGNHPKIYAYNVSGDPDLERRLMDGRGWLDRQHWRARQRWPSHVRRAIDPAELYGGVVDRAPLRWMLLVERADVPRITTEPLHFEEAAAISAEVLVDELRKSTPDVTDYLARAGRPTGLRWGPDSWAQTLRPALASADIIRVRVPATMTARDYRSAMVSFVDALADGD